MLVVPEESAGQEVQSQVAETRDSAHIEKGGQVRKSFNDGVL
jgi:hypothetical protein